MHDAEFLDALRTSAFEVLADQCPIERVHRHIDSDAPFDATLWQTIGELGWPMLAVPETQGGMADGMAALALIQEAIGAHCAPLPFASTVLLATALAGWHDAEFAQPLAEQIASGQITGAGAARPVAQRVEGGFALTGEVGILDGCGSAWTVVAFDDIDGRDAGLAIVETASLALDRRPVADRTRTMAVTTFTNLSLPDTQVMYGEAGHNLGERLRHLALLLAAADAVGGGEALLVSTVEYLKTRIQFGRPIGAFQALKHRIADCRTAIEMARSLLVRARQRAEETDGYTLAAMAKALACKAYMAIAREAVQMHGGIGYTWEHHAHIYLKRATLNEALCGGRAKVQDLIAARLLELTA